MYHKKGEGYLVIESKEDLEEIRDMLVEACQAFIAFEDFKELRELFIEACHELENGNTNKNLSLDK